ncbi:hypothetical protein [Nitrosococcus watsonii]|uniref:Uncharacterized protein n=1 Tax=Nitrosococcus watsoni (strain C-113) TaxID=105559 RepID=D8K9A5_NITWC|nr:hypothetical protein [Nitrosococcus watsonii]ADJ29248.1 hypothetical protein Nwat_2433 [Nitrosococcus watsonii C-113]
MEPVIVIVSAFAAGAAVAVKSTTEQAIQDAYQGLKALIQSKYGDVALETLEKKPESEAKQASVAEDLTDADAGNDEELLDQAKALLDAIKAHEPQAAATIGVDLEKVEAEYIRLKDILSTGTGVRGRDIKTRGGVEVEGVRAGYNPETDPKKS